MYYNYLIGEESILTFLAIKRRAVMYHFWMDLHLMNPLHMVSKLFHVFYISIAHFTNHESSPLVISWLTRFHRLHMSLAFAAGRILSPSAR